ncbi:tape measure protein [Staphylococcus saprophyticus]|uniref:tape measure protein n=1 Tax=Staphylococcus saprophyticus TaxID=29385 RepID=UPI00384B3D95
MAEDIRSMRIQLSMQDMGVERTVGQIKKSFSTLKSEVSSSNKMFNYSEKSADSYKKHIDSLNSSHKLAEKNLKDLKSAYHAEGEAQGYATTKALNLQKAIADQEKELHFLKRDLDNATASFKEFEKAQAIDSSGFTKVGKSIQSMSTGLSNVSQKMVDVGSGLTNKITKPALIAGGAMAGITAKLGFDRLVGLDSAKAKLEGLGYSTKEVGSITDQVTRAIKGGMTTMAEGTDVAAGALASGVKEGKELEKYIKLVGDAAVGSNRPVADMAMIFNRVQGQGKLMTEELNMVEEGMPGFSKAMAKHLGVSYEAFREMVTNGEVTSQDFLTVMDDFAGGMAGAYSKSFKGMVQNTKAYVGMIGESLLSGVFEQSKSSLHEFEKLLQSPGAQQWAKETGVQLGNAFSAIANGIKGVINWWNSLDGSTQKVLGGIIKWAGLTLIAVGPLLTIFGKIGLAISSMFGPISGLLLNMGKVSGAMKTGATFGSAFASVFPKIGMVLGALTGPIGLTVLAITGIGTALVIAYKKSETFRNIVNGALQGVIAGFKLLWTGVMAVLTPIGNAIASFGRQLAKTFGQFWAENGPQFMQALNNIKTGFMVVWSIIRPIISGIGTLFKAVFGGILSFIQFIMPAIQAIFRVGWAVVKYIFVSTWEAIKGVVNGGLNIIMGLIKVFSGLFTGDFRKMWEGVKQIFFGAFQFIWNLVQLWFVGKIFGLFKLGLGLIKSVVSGSLGAVRGTFSSVLGSIWGIVKRVFGWISSFMRNIFSNIWKFTKAIWSNIKLAITNPVALIRKIVPQTFRVMSNIVRTIFSGLKKAVSVIFQTMKTVVVNIAKALSNLLKGNFTGMRKNLQNITNALKNAVIKLWRILKDTVINVAKSLWSGVKDKFNGLKKSATDITQKLKNAVKDKWEALKKNVVDLATGAKDGVVKGFKAMYNKGVEWLDKLKGFIKNAKDGFKKVASDLGKGVANGAISGLNAMIDGINTLSDKIMKKKLIKKKIPKLSTGTGANPAVKTDSQGRLTKSTKAIVNDKGIGNGKGSKGHKELIYRRNGKIEQPRGNNKKVSLKRGDAVYNGMQSKAMLPHLSTGTGADLLKQAKKRKKHEEPTGDMFVPKNSGFGGGNIAEDALNWTKETAKKAKDSFGKAIGDVMDYVENPGKLVSKVMKHFGVDFSSIKGAYGGVMDFGYNGLKNGLKSLISGWFEEQSGSGDGGYIDLSRGINFGFARTGAEAIAQGYPFARPHHGIDVNYPYGTNVYSTISGKATGTHGYNGGFGNNMTITSGIMKVIYGHLSKLNWTGTRQVKPGDLLGKSGGDPSRQGANAGDSTGPHLHYEMQWNGVAKDPLPWLKKNNGGGKAGGKYGSTIKQALGMAGLPQTSQYIKAWQEQARTESTFNPKARNPSGASGLVQVKPATFNAFKLPGHGNIWNPLDNLIAGMRYAKATYGPKKMLNQIGHGLPYKTGGIISTDGTYRLADGGYPEAVMSLDPSRASDTMKLMNYVQSKIGTSDKKNKRPNQIPNKYANTSQSNNSAEMNMMAQQLQATQEQNNLLMQLLGVTKNIEQQPKGYNTDDVSKGLGKKAKMAQFNYGM